MSRHNTLYSPFLLREETSSIENHSVEALDAKHAIGQNFAGDHLDERFKFTHARTPVIDSVLQFPAGSWRLNRLGL
jgi:hypothetical protein